MNAEEHASMARASAFDDEVAAERGRLFAVRSLLENPEKLREMEGIFGKPYCQRRFPEVYRPGEWRAVLEFIPGMGEVSTGPEIPSGKTMVLVPEIP
jgi:hypothetical protein